MNAGKFNVLVICKSNSALSIMAEALFNTMGRRVFRAFSGGTSPIGQIHPMAREKVLQTGYPTFELRSKSWEEFFLTPPAPVLDFIITMGNDIADVQHPVWPGNPVLMHWGL